jgi:hypothetical protein
MGVKAVHRADKLATFMCRLSKNLGASASWNPQGLSRPVMGLLYLHLQNKILRFKLNLNKRRNRDLVIEIM